MRILRYASRILQSTATVDINGAFGSGDPTGHAQVHGTAVVLNEGTGGVGDSTATLQGKVLSSELTAMSAMKNKVQPLALSRNSLWQELTGSRLAHRGERCCVQTV